MSCNGMPQQQGGYTFGFLAVIVLGFCTWEGGLVGIQIPNYQFKRFQALLKSWYTRIFCRCR
ncbi:hypothetical protein C427_4230 [Paraglaciecola psychrophila 170]|uniref:Uncharacterized protein n=1 Tax=Paraglaciecola psychrophila 170 TaxID=1129794 RepID=M4RRP1_9ALTE|nr:hypothetical protein C427_4230 [Paraglaciecola psychrophila 170]